MVYDKSYYDMLNLIESKLETIKNLNSELNLNNLNSSISNVREEIEKIDSKFNSLVDYFNSRLNLNLNSEDVDTAIRKIKELKETEEKQLKASLAIQNAHNNKNIKEEIAYRKIYNDEMRKAFDLRNELNQIGISDTFLNDDKLMNRLTNSLDIVDNKLNDIRHNIVDIGKSTKKLNEENKEWKKNIDNIKKGYQQFASNLKKSFNIIKDSTEFWRKQDEQITKMVATFGLTNDELKKYRDASYKAGVELAFQYGKTQEDMVKLQQGYAEATGKNIVLTKDNYEAQFQLQQLMGDENSLAFTSGIEQFGVGINDARDRLYEIYKLNKTTGVSWSKTSKELNNNLKLAQKYNFKGGLDNMMKMTVWANKMKINMQTIGSIADKISNPEGAIETAAKLQVLGGAFATMANPLQMLYESLDDVGGLAQRVEKMFDGIGRFDRDLGEVRIAGPDRLRVKAAAEAMGMSYEEAMNIVNNKAKRGAVEQDVKFNPEITKDNRDFLATLAQWNNDKKQFEVRTYDEKNRQYINRNINELSNEEIEKLRQEPDDDIRKLVENTFSINANIDKLVNGAKMALAATQEDKYGDTLRNQLKNGNDMLSQMKHLGETLDSFYQAALIYYGAKGLGGAWKTGKGLFNMGKMVRNGRFPNTFGGNMTNNMIGKWSNLSKAGKIARVGGVGGGLLAGGISGGMKAYDTYKSVEAMENDRLLAIKNGELLEGSAQDKKILKDIKKAKNTGYGGAIGKGVGTGLGAWGGMAAGAAIGSAFGGVGAIPGALIGLIMGGLGAWAGGELGDKVGTFAGDTVSVDDGIANKKTVVKANKDDTALFAKDNGPFDKLFGNIIPKIDNNMKVSNEVYYNKKFNNENVNIPKVGDVKNEIIEPKPIGEDVSKIKEVNIKDSVRPKDVKIPDINIKPIDININGTLKLDMGTSGQIDIMKELKNNPSFMRELSRMLVEQMSNSLNGGKPKLDQNRFARFQS
uniref:Tail tape measure protein n=1 Tax=Myoviridae sp. ctNQV2 TaxID=2827683 RepID=A0A8S5RZU3_9CAUD|nr:MAG TPA: protein of unknown function (DUF3482) [Myoviridae sp. ctNQV2]